MSHIATSLSIGNVASCGSGRAAPPPWFLARKKGRDSGCGKALDMIVALCDIIGDMSTLSEYIKAQPEKTKTQWAERFGISRPYLYSLMDGTRQPSIDVAQRIAKATGGKVPVTAWPNMAAIVSAAFPARQPRPSKPASKWRASA